MNGKNSFRKWTDMRGMAVTVPAQGKTVGQVENFFFDAESNEVYALYVNVGVYGYRALTSNAIRTIERDAVTIDNDQMLIDPSHDGRLNVLFLGHELLSYKVKDEKGNSRSTISNVVLATYPPVALRVVAFELANGRTVDANEVAVYERDAIVLMAQVARRL
jgi:sporulation protein YlmC with PRC-barrel domain